MLLNTLQFLVRGMFYLFIVWHRVVPEKTARRLRGPSNHAKRSA